MSVNEQIVTGRKFRKLVDEATKLWQRISFWTKASDVEFNDGSTAETKMGAINGITDSLVSTSSNVAASAKALNQLNNKLADQLPGDVKLIIEGSGAETKYYAQVGADTASKKLLGNDIKLNRGSVNGTAGEQIKIHVDGKIFAAMTSAKISGHIGIIYLNEDGSLPQIGYASLFANNTLDALNNGDLNINSNQGTNLFEYLIFYR